MGFRIKLFGPVLLLSLGVLAWSWQQGFGHVFVGIVLAFAAAAAIGLEFAIRRPIAHLSQASARLAAGDFQAPLPAAGTDELGVLARAFDTMREAIKRYQEDLSFRATHVV